MKYSVEVDDKKFLEVQERLGKLHNKAPNVISSAINRATTTINSNVKKEARKEYIIKAGDIQKTLTKTKATKSNLGAEVRSSGGTIPLDKFKVSPKTVNPRRKSPVKVAVKKGSNKPMKGAFMADVSGPKLFKRTGKKRLPIERLFGPSVPQMLGNEEVKEKIEAAGLETFEKRLDQNIKNILERGRS